MSDGEPDPDIDRWSPWRLVQALLIREPPD